MIEFIRRVRVCGEDSYPFLYIGRQVILGME